MTNIRRREFLRGLGVAITLPAFESLCSATENTTDHVARRLVCVSTNYGMNPGGFFPEQTGTEYAMPLLLKPMEPHRRDLTIFTNLGNSEILW